MWLALFNLIPNPFWILAQAVTGEAANQHAPDYKNLWFKEFDSIMWANMLHQAVLLSVILDEQMYNHWLF